MEYMYMVCWESNLHSDVSINWHNFSYQDFHANGEYYLVSGKEKREAAEKFFEFQYDSIVRCTPIEEFREELFNEFLRSILEEVRDTMFDNLSRKNEIFELAIEIHDIGATILEKKKCSSNKDEQPFEEIKKLYEEEKLFSLLSIEDIKKMWFSYNIKYLAIVELIEI